MLYWYTSTGPLRGYRFGADILGYGTFNAKAVWTPVVEDARRKQVLIDVVKIDVAFSGISQSKIGESQSATSLFMMEQREKALAAAEAAVRGCGAAGVRARAMMTMRATTERNTSDTLDPYGGKTVALNPIFGSDPLAVCWGDHAICWGDHALEWGGGLDGLLHCYVQARSEDTRAKGGGFVAVATHTLWAPLGSDLEEEDYVTAVENRRGTILFPHRMLVTSLIRREDHLEAMLREAS